MSLTLSKNGVITAAEGCAKIYPRMLVGSATFICVSCVKLPPTTRHYSQVRMVNRSVEDELGMMMNITVKYEKKSEIRRIVLQLRRM